VEFGLLAQAAGMFAVTNVDDIVILAVFFGRAADGRAARRSRWGHVILPVVLIGIGLVILIEGGAFGL
jgi:cadmium resistance protein CadD (predicted permease)